MKKGKEECIIYMPMSKTSTWMGLKRCGPKCELPLHREVICEKAEGEKRKIEWPSKILRLNKFNFYLNSFFVKWMKSIIKDLHLTDKRKTIKNKQHIKTSFSIFSKWNQSNPNHRISTIFENWYLQGLTFFLIGLY